MRIVQKQNKKRRLTLIALLIAALVLVLGYFSFAYITKNAWPFIQDTQTNSDNINYSPPTDQEVKDSQNGKKNSNQQVDGGATAPKPNSSKNKVSVGIAFASYDVDEKAVDVRAFTPDVIEGDGTCTATLTRGATTVSQSSKAFIDSSSSQCQPILIPESRFDTKGVWKLIVTYTSSKSSGSSPSMDVEIN